MVVALFRLMVELQISARLAFWGALLFAVAPSTILYERVLLYTYPIMAALAVGLWLLARACRAGNWQSWAAAFFVLALPCWLHSFFHPVYLLGVGLACVITAPVKRWVIVSALLPALVFAAAPTVKNGLLYGVWDSSHWAPFSFTNIATFYTSTAAERRALGFATPLTSLRPFDTALGEYAVSGSTLLTGLPVLDTANKTDGSKNWMALDAVRVGKALQQENMVVVKAKPGLYWRGIQGAAYFYMQSPSQGLWSKNRDRLHIYNSMWAFFTTGQWVSPDVPLYSTFRKGFDPVANPMPKTFFGWGNAFGWENFPFLSLVLLPVLFGAGVYQALRQWWRREALAPVWAVMVVLVGYVTLLSLTMELGENMRFKGYVGSMFLIWLFKKGIPNWGLMAYISESKPYLTGR
jgi:hypothetical protein